VERNKEGDGFGRLWWGETKEGDAVGGARLTIEIGAEFPIGITGSKTLVSDSVSEGATISVQWEPPDRLRRESFEGARKEG
jgi:hypothetical protein